MQETSRDLIQDHVLTTSVASSIVQSRKSLEKGKGSVKRIGIFCGSSDLAVLAQHEVVISLNGVDKIKGNGLQFLPSANNLMNMFFVNEEIWTETSQLVITVTNTGTTLIATDVILFY
jgi:hypothetical protein